MRVCVLASGSKGNSTYIEADNHKILIDVGITFKDLERRLECINVSVNDIDTLLITHSHSDHTKGLSVFAKKVNANIYMSNKTYNDLKLDIDYIEITNDFMIDNINVTSITMSHDVDCHGYIIEYDNNSLVYVTDTGYVNEKYYDVLKDRTIYIFESNHDITMNMHSKKPKIYRERVVGDYGHLSNNQASYYLSKLAGRNTKYIVLAHLSEDDNKEELALEMLEENLKKNNKVVPNVGVAYQHKNAGMIEV